jgi:hypothetical protein
MKTDKHVFVPLLKDIKTDNVTTKMKATLRALDIVNKNYKLKRMVVLIRKVKKYVKESNMNELAKLYSTIILQLNKRHRNSHKITQKKYKCSGGGGRKQPRNNIAASPILPYNPNFAPKTSMPIVLPPALLENERSNTIKALTTIAFIIIIYIISLLNHTSSK